MKWFTWNLHKAYDGFDEPWKFMAFMVVLVPLLGILAFRPIFGFFLVLMVIVDRMVWLHAGKHYVEAKSENEDKVNDDG